MCEVAEPVDRLVIIQVLYYSHWLRFVRGVKWVFTALHDCVFLGIGNFALIGQRFLEVFKRGMFQTESFTSGHTRFQIEMVKLLISCFKKTERLCKNRLPTSIHLIQSNAKEDDNIRLKNQSKCLSIKEPCRPFTLSEFSWADRDTSYLLQTEF